MKDMHVPLFCGDHLEGRGGEGRGGEGRGGGGEGRGGEGRGDSLHTLHRLLLVDV